MLGTIGVLYFGIRTEYQSVSVPRAQTADEQLLALPEIILTVEETELLTRVVYTNEKRQQGLSGTTGLPEGTGLLFVFPQNGMLSFWMKDMNYPIDMWWLDESGSVLHIEPAVSPDTYPESFGASVPARFVLETNAGVADALGVAVGDQVDLGPDIATYLELAE